MKIRDAKSGVNRTKLSLIFSLKVHHYMQHAYATLLVATGNLQNILAYVSLLSCICHHIVFLCICIECSCLHSSVSTPAIFNIWSALILNNFISFYLIISIKNSFKIKSNCVQWIGYLPCTQQIQAWYLAPHILSILLSILVVIFEYRSIS